ncbi:hypothetical protein RUM44_008130 [Polyplax serrata]|uniref:Cyclin-H n=1 Tax=Polyplax serrata TaxID=468196 RepID=A0ABR1BCB7_POLSC
MYPVSSQKKNWTFTDEAEIDSLRRMANERFIERFGGAKTEEEKRAFFLTPEEELILLKGSELLLREFCRKFSPPMPKSVVGTSYHYFKRFYINNSVMDYHPKEILVTCVYLSCKVEEFNISIVQFVSNIKGDREKAAEIILNNELLLMQQLNYYLTVHNPYRPIEGLIIDIKTRYPQMRDPERLRGGIDEFIDKVYQTEAVLLYSPSQIALAAILHAASNVQENLDLYVTEILFGSDKQYLARIIEVVRNVRLKVKMIELPSREVTKPLEDKLSRCRNQENNPDSEIYKKKRLDMLNEEDERQVRKYAKISERMRNSQNKFLGINEISDSPKEHV